MPSAADTLAEIGRLLDGPQDLAAERIAAAYRAWRNSQPCRCGHARGTHAEPDACFGSDDDGKRCECDEFRLICWLCAGRRGIAIHRKWSAERGADKLPLWTAHEYPSDDPHPTEPCPACGMGTEYVAVRRSDLAAYINRGTGNLHDEVDAFKRLLAAAGIED